MKIVLLVIGKTTDNRLASLTDEYVGRVGHYVPFAIKVLPDVRRGKTMSEDEQKKLEGAAILKAAEASFIVLLDEHGRQYRSVEYAEQLQKWMAGGSAGRDITFVIGGPYGFSPEVYKAANAQLSLSQMTFNHEMVRLIFVEQLYRGLSILKGEKYHHE